MSIIVRVFAALIVAAVSCSAVAQNDGCAGARDLTIVNGRIHTMDARDAVVSSVTIRRGLFVAATAGRDACMDVIDVHGRTVVPGLIDNHNHFVLLAERPGHD
ncbi:MAG: hypothetical protein WA825_07210, partial [Steroidobacteraceae bacterium]